MENAKDPMVFDFNVKTNAKFGAEKALHLAQYIKELSLKRPGVIVDGGIAGLDYVKKVIAALENDPDLSVKVWVYDLQQEPDYDSLDRIKTMFLDTGEEPVTDCFVGIGGGSVIDFAKGLATVVVNPGKAVQYKGFPTGIVPSLPTIALPTTAGTGSEVTYNAVFTDNDAKKKLGINTRNNYPALAILDPLFTVNSPAPVWVSSGMDALVHTLETYMAVQATPVSRIFSREAFAMLFNNLPRIKDAPDNVDFRAKVQFGAYLAGIALINSGSGVAGALSYPLGVHFKVPHGMAGAVFISQVIRHNVNAGYDFSGLYDLIDDADHDLPKNKKNAEFCERMFALCRKLAVPETLGAYGVNAKTVELFINEIPSLERAFAQNPVPFTVEDGKRLVRSMTP
jgi:alcohol dehydrogenase